MVKKNYKLLIGILIGMILSASGVYAAETIIESINVSYDNSNSGGKFTTVQESIDDLYEKSGLLDHKWVDPVLNGADPVLEVEGSTKKLIPITLDNDGTVHYANLYTKWYDYSDKKWANAVILVDNPKNGGKEKYTYKTGDIINENDIESYFVWIPRYSYKIWNMGNYNSAPNITTLDDNNYETSSAQAFNKERIIAIKFGDVKTNPKMSETDAKLDSYYTHPAFTLGDKDLNGVWVGKFETGYNQSGDNGNPIDDTSKWTVTGANQDEEASTRIIVKPNVYSWRSCTINNMFLSAYNYARTLESHMMKNTEWGAIAYLSHSMYGINSEININNNQNYVTGYGAAEGTKQETREGQHELVSPNKNTNVTQSYNTLAGYLASTTGNITGVYDMSGGALEEVCGYVEGLVGSSKMDLNKLTTIYKDYCDVYSNNSNVNSYNNRILGDATGEMGPFYQYYDGYGTSGVEGSLGTSNYHNSWYTDWSFFVSKTAPWFARGGTYIYGGVASQFTFFYASGGTGTHIATRLVLAPK